MKNILKKSMEKEGTKNITPQMKVRSNIRSGDCASCCASLNCKSCSCNTDGTSCNCDYYIIK